MLDTYRVFGHELGKLCAINQPDGCDHCRYVALNVDASGKRTGGDEDCFGGSGPQGNAAQFINRSAEDALFWPELFDLDNDTPAAARHGMLGHQVVSAVGVSANPGGAS
jgi:hypothetical protein